MNAPPGDKHLTGHWISNAKRTVKHNLLAKIKKQSKDKYYITLILLVGIHTALEQIYHKKNSQPLKFFFLLVWRRGHKLIEYQNIMLRF